MTQFLRELYTATWVWLPFLILFLVQGLRCSPQVKLVLFKIGLYYIVCAIGLQLLLPAAHLGLRTMLFDLTTRAFLFIQAAEMLWNSWSANPSRSLMQPQLVDDDDDEDEPVRLVRRGITAHQKALIGYAVMALLYLGWTLLGVLFAFTLTPGM